MKQPTLAYWLISFFAFIWNLMGVGAYIAQSFMTDAQIIEANGEIMGAAIIAQPAWYTAVFALAVFAGSLGCLGLLLRRKWAVLLLGLSLLCVIIQNVYFAMSGVFSLMSGAQWIMPIMIPVIAIFLVWYARKNAQQGTLR